MRSLGDGVGEKTNQKWITKNFRGDFVITMIKILLKKPQDEGLKIKMSVYKLTSLQQH